MTKQETASLILAAGIGSRMGGYHGNKTLLPLIPGESPFEGSHPILLNILGNLPPGPKATVTHHRKEDVINTTRSLGIEHYEQPFLNGTGGALIAAREFVEAQAYDRLIITMGDIPFVKSSTYLNLIEGLRSSSMVVLGFRPLDKKQYGVLITRGVNVRKIIEWEYWRKYPKQRQEKLQICNAGIYAARRKDLAGCLGILQERPHTVKKERNGKIVEVEEFFITDLVELMQEAGLNVGYAVAEDEEEVMGVDDLPSLLKAQKIFALKARRNGRM